MTPLPRGPWLNLSIDFCGLLSSGHYLTVTDEYFRYPVVEIIRSLTVETVIQTVDKIFCAHGYPEIIKFDNGPPFNSQAWKSFLIFVWCNTSQNHTVMAEG